MFDSGGESNGSKFDKISQRDDAALTKSRGNEKLAMKFMSLDSSRRLSRLIPISMCFIQKVLPLLTKN